MIAVLFFHFELPFISGGFVGVNIFFVISGFLITSIILSDLDQQRFSLAQFFNKRIWRLFPALFATILASSLAAYVIFMPAELIDFAKSIIASSLYLSNLYFYLSNDYFAGPSQLKPLLHTWSLAVEEQFYFVFPFVLMFIYKRYPSKLLGILLSLSCLSFVLGTAYLWIDSSASFYLSPFRFWELLIGAILAYGLHAKVFKSVHQTSFAALLSLIGFLTIFFSMLHLDKSNRFPGFWALLPTLGTALLIYAGPNTGLVSRALQSRVMVYVGKISYSLYLWHWPVLVFYSYYFVQAIGPLDQALMLIITLGLSLFSYYVFEQTFRKRAAQQSLFTALASTALLSMIFISISAFTLYREGFPERFDSLIIDQEGYSQANMPFSECFLKKQESISDYDLQSCKINSSEDNKSMVLWGDSHAHHLFSGMQTYWQERDESLILFASAGCPPILNEDPKGRANCRQNNSAFIELISKEQVHTVILAASWHFAKHESGVDLSKLEHTIKTLSDLNIEVVVLNQLPIYSFSNPKFILTRLQQANALDKDYYSKPARGLGVIDEIKTSAGDARVIDLHRAFCEPSNDCLVYRNGKLMVSDQAHLSRAGSAVAAQYIVQAIEQTK